MDAATDLGVPWEVALDEQVLQKVLRRLAVPTRIGESLKALIDFCGEGFELTKRKAEKMATSLPPGWVHLLLLSSGSSTRRDRRWRFREWEPCLLEVTDSLDVWDEIELTRNGLPIQVRIQIVGGVDRDRVAEWPRSDSGRYEIRLGPETLSVTIQPQKITTPELGAMVRELEHELPATIALSLQKCGALTGVDLLPPAMGTLKRFNRIRRAVSGTPTTSPAWFRCFPHRSRPPRNAEDHRAVDATAERAQTAGSGAGTGGDREGNIDTRFRPPGRGFAGRVHNRRLREQASQGISGRNRSPATSP